LKDSLGGSGLSLLFLDLTGKRQELLTGENAETAEFAQKTMRFFAASFPG